MRNHGERLQSSTYARACVPVQPHTPEKVVCPHACRPLTEESTRYIRNTFDLRHPGKDGLVGKITIAVEWVKLLAEVSAAAARLEVEASTATEPDPDTAGLQGEEAVLEWHVGNLSIKVRRTSGVQLPLPEGSTYNRASDVQPALLCPHDKLYASFKFLDFPEGVSKAITGASGPLNYTLRSKVLVDKKLVVQLASHGMEIQVHKRQAFTHTLLGSAHVRLSDVLACLTNPNGVKPLMGSVEVTQGGSLSMLGRSSA